MTSPLRAGAAKTVISPEKGIQIAGDIGRHRPCSNVLEPLYARALALEHAGERYAILSIDVLAIDNPWADEIRRRAQETYQLAPERLIIHITQNHAAPSIGNHFCRDSCTLLPDEYAWLRGGDPRYNAPAVTGCVDALGMALANMQPVTVAVGRAIDGRVAFNRRFVLRDGTTVCHPPQCSPNILHVEGPTDPEVGIATFTNSEGQVISALLHHTCHPCHGYGANDALAGWPGAWCDEMEAHFGAGCTPLVINGCCGNVHYVNHADPHPLWDHRIMGQMLADSTRTALAQMTPVDAATFAWARRVLPLPRREISPALLAEAQRMLAEHPTPLWQDDNHVQVSWDWVYAVGILDIADERTTHPHYPYEMQALRLGNFALLSLMGEPFVEAQLRIKRESPFPFLQIAHMCNGYLGYVPTRRAFAGGGYETRTGRGSRLVPEALEMIEDASVELLNAVRENTSCFQHA